MQAFTLPGLLACALLLAGCGDLAVGNVETAGQSAKSTSGPVVVEVISAAVTVRQLSNDIEAIGTAQASEFAQVVSKMPGTIAAIRFEDGDRVRRGDVLVELDSHPELAVVREAQAALTMSEAQFERARSLRQQQVFSAAQVDSLEATMKGDRARLDAANARFADTIIRAGFDGRVGLRQVSVGSLAGPDIVITTLDDTAEIRLEFMVPENRLHQLRTGLEVTAKSVGMPGRRFRGAVTALDSRVNERTRSIAVRALVPNPDGALRPGMFLNLQVHTAVAPVLMIPEEAVMPEQGKTFVLVVRDSVIERRQVHTGQRRPGEVEVVSGLESSERVVTQGVQNVRTGTRVREKPVPAATG